jgi:hypothetical protein
MKPKLKPPGAKRLKLKCDIPLSNFGFKFNLRRYSMGAAKTRIIASCRQAIKANNIHSLFQIMNFGKE